MNQSSVIGAALVIAYVIFVITKGELPCYMQTLGITSKAGCPQPLQPAGCGGATTSGAPASGSSGAAPISPGAGSGAVGPGGGRMIGIPIPRITVPGGSQTY